MALRRALSALAHLLLAAASSSQSDGADGYVRHAASPLPGGWAWSGLGSEDGAVTVRFSLRQLNLDRLAAEAYEVSDPRSARYGTHLSALEVAELTSPEASDVQLVTRWLAEEGVDFTHKSGSEVVEVTLPAGRAASLLRTEFRTATCAATGQSVLQAADYWVPAEVDAVVSAVYGLHGLPLPPRRSRHTQAAIDPASVTPSVLAKTYSIKVPAKGAANNTQAVAEFQGQTMKKSDLASFFKRFFPKSPTSHHVVHRFVGKHPLGDGGDEASLDIEYIMGVAPGLPTEFWYWGGNDFCGDLKLWTGAIISAHAAGRAPLVHSVSYGWQGELSGIGCQSSKVSDIDANFAKLAAMGITVVFASGDSGSGYGGQDVEADPGAPPPHHKHFPLYPSWPASSPWVTAVGSTRFVKNKVGNAEMATDQFGSGGGFSAQFPAFSDQKEAVQKYLQMATGLPPSKAFPAGGRATPDVSALGEGYQVIANGDWEGIGGTSASAPMFAGLVSLLNRARLNAGKPAMGYINPWLYQNPQAFTDVVIGSNKIGHEGEKLKYGYQCAKGWDPVTGLGTPKFDKMLSAALAAVQQTQTQIVV